MTAGNYNFSYCLSDKVAGMYKFTSYKQNTQGWELQT